METTPHTLFPQEAVPFSLFPVTLSILISTVQVFDPLLGSLIPLLYLNQRSSDLKTQKNGIATAKENRLFGLFNDPIGNITNRFKTKTISETHRQQNHMQVVKEQVGSHPPMFLIQ